MQTRPFMFLKNLGNPKIHPVEGKNGVPSNAFASNTPEESTSDTILASNILEEPTSDTILANNTPEESTSDTILANDISADTNAISKVLSLEYHTNILHINSVNIFNLLSRQKSSSIPTRKADAGGSNPQIPFVEALYRSIYNEGAIPDHISNYRITRILGAGTYGSVLSAENTLFGTKVALKVFTSYTAFLRELLVMSYLFSVQSLETPKYVAPVLSIIFPQATGDVNTFRIEIPASEHDPAHTLINTHVPILAYEHYDMDLASYVKDKVISTAELKHITESILVCLSFLHVNGVIHGDMKKENLLVRLNPHDTAVLPRLVLGDLGCSSVAITVENAEGRSGFTPSFRPPEDLLLGKYSAKADIYGAGWILADLIHDTSRLLFPELKSFLLNSGKFNAYSGDRDAFILTVQRWMIFKALEGWVPKKKGGLNEMLSEATLGYVGGEEWPVTIDPALTVPQKFTLAMYALKRKLKSDILVLENMKELCRTVNFGDAITTIRRMVHPDPEERWSADRLLRSDVWIDSSRRERRLFGIF